MRLLIAEDDTRLLKSLKYIFEKNKYLVDAVSTGTEALAYGMTGEYDGMILDIMMPGMDGVDVLKELRAKGISTPALFLTAKTEVYQKVEGLDAGADDYLSKPFSQPELLARVRAMLRRKENYVPELLTVCNVSLNRSTYELIYADDKKNLSGKEFQIMEMLMQSPGIIITSEQLLSHIWGWNSEVEISTVWVHISNIRKKLTALDAPLEIRFVRNAGYMLEEKR